MGDVGWGGVLLLAGELREGMGLLSGLDNGGTPRVLGWPTTPQPQVPKPLPAAAANKVAPSMAGAMKDVAWSWVQPLGVERNVVLWQDCCNRC
jgi:hypothetical protein